MRRIALTAMLAAVVLLFGALPAAAAVTLEIRSPSGGQEISSSVGTQVRAQRQLFDPGVDAVQLRLVRNGSPTSGAGLTCVQGCGGTDQIWGQVAIDPRSPDEFGLSHPMANGAWTVQAQWRNSGDGTWSAWGGDVSVTVSFPPSPVSGLTADADDLDVTLTWNRAPEPDISSYRVQRRPHDGPWANLPSVDASTSRYEDSTPSAGSYEYRVVTVRPDGHGGVLTATSSVASVRTNRPSSDPSPTTSGGSGGTSGGDGDSSGGTSGATSDGTSGGTSDGSSGGTSDGTSDGASGGPSEPTEDGTSADGSGTSTGDGEDAGSTSGRSYGRARVAPPPGVRQGSSLDIDASLPEPEVAPRQEERFYGEGEGFSEELDYGGAEAVLPVAPEASGRSVLQRIPGGVQEFIVSRFETRTLLRSVAAGLLFVALGLHAYRWMHGTPND